MSMSTSEFCSAVFTAFRPDDTDSIKYCGVKEFEVVNDIFEVPGKLSFVEFVSGNFVTINIVFGADWLVPAHEEPGYFGGPGKHVPDYWIRGSVPISIRMTRDEMAEKLGFSKGQTSASSSLSLR